MGAEVAVSTSVDLTKHIARLREIRETVEERTVQFLLEAGEVVRQTAMESIREGTIRGPGHIPSLPGQPPKGDTGRLELSIDVELRASERSVNVIARAPYAAALEFGTARIAPRPFMRPALQQHRSRFVTGMAMVASGERAVRVFKNSTASIAIASAMTGR